MNTERRLKNRLEELSERGGGAGRSESDLAAWARVEAHAVGGRTAPSSFSCSLAVFPVFS